MYDRFLNQIGLKGEKVKDKTVKTCYRNKAMKIVIEIYSKYILDKNRFPFEDIYEVRDIYEKLCNKVSPTPVLTSDKSIKLVLKVKESLAEKNITNFKSLHVVRKVRLIIDIITPFIIDYLDDMDNNFDFPYSNDEKEFWKDHYHDIIFGFVSSFNDDDIE